jgi:hypothetical protein
VEVVREALEGLYSNYLQPEASATISEKRASDLQKQLAEPEAKRSEDDEERRAERALQLKAKGWGKAKIILEVWGVSKGGSQKYKDAEAEYKRLVEESA